MKRFAASPPQHNGQKTAWARKWLYPEEGIGAGADAPPSWESVLYWFQRAVLMCDIALSSGAGDNDAICCKRPHLCSDRTSPGARTLQAPTLSEHRIFCHLGPSRLCLFLPFYSDT